MRLEKYLNEEDIIQQALGIDEPEEGGEYTDDEAQRIIDVLVKAIDIQAEKVDGLEDGEQYDAALVVLKDLKDKLEKWENRDEEVKSKGPNPDPEMMPEEPIQEEPPEEEK